jgi:hypothetical protein
MTFHLEDTVREKKTGRQGKIDELRSEMFRVIFLDNQNPPLQYFKSVEEFELVNCPHSEPGPAFVPDHGIMG